MLGVQRRRSEDLRMEPHTVELCETLFFEARTVTLPFASSEYSRRIHDEMNPESDSSSSSCGYSSRIHDLMKLQSEAGMSKEDAEIEASKSHWTETAPGSASTESCEELLEAEKLYKENLEVMRSLQSEDVNGFFQIGGMVSGRKITEGGQAIIHDGGRKRHVGLDGEEEEGERGLPTLLKVFKAGYSLSNLQKQWPLALLQKYNLRSEEDLLFFPISCGRLLEDGRFAFEMVKWWGDLRKLSNARLIGNGNRHPPLMMSDGHYHECCILEMWFEIAMGMEVLHNEGTLHRDLKASNVLVENWTWHGNVSNMEEGRLDPLELKHSCVCLVADYECSIRVVGTGFWRAPEILEAVKNRAIYNIPNLFTLKVDVYSYAMTCYEILTGLVPFEHFKDHGTTIEDVIGGKQPTLPKHLKPWVEEMLCKCWHVDPSMRPSFEEIYETLKERAKIGLQYHNNSSYYMNHEILGTCKIECSIGGCRHRILEST